MQVELDNTVARPHPRLATSKGGSQAPVVRVFGVTREGNSVALFVHGFQPYFYIEVPGCPDAAAEATSPEKCEALRRVLEATAVSASRNRGLDAHVLRVEPERRCSMWNHQPGGHRPFLKVTVALPELITPLRTALDRGQVPLPWCGGGYGSGGVMTYESNVMFALRFMIDRGVQGCSWLEIPAGKWCRRANRTSTCQIEADVSAADLVAHAPDKGGRWSEIAPLRVLSVDIECAGRKGLFPDAKFDPVIQIASHVSVVGGPSAGGIGDADADAVAGLGRGAAGGTREGERAGPLFRNIQVLDTCAPIVGAQVESHGDERALLRRWRDLLVASDADIITGWNTTNFDLPYLLDRAETLDVQDFPHWGRIRSQRVRMRDTVFSSKAHGTRSYKEITIEGRVQLDMLTLIQRDHKLSSYSLNAVSAHFLGEQKEDVHHSDIAALQAGTAETRRRLAVYCLKDALLPQRLFDKLSYLYNYAEMARVTGVPLGWLVSRGQAVKVFSQILRKCRAKGLVVPHVARGGPGGGDEGGGSYEGATVLEAKAGFHDRPIATLDFASLYPSIMMAHNLCYTTLVPRERVSRYRPEDVTRTPSGDTFVKGSVTEGLLPEILRELLAARKQAKREMAVETDAFRRAVLDGRQQALKVSANSVYGFTGATVGKMPCLEISASVTAFGREMIEHTKSLVEATTWRDPGPDGDEEAALTADDEALVAAGGGSFRAEVVYGDTDSVMVRFVGVADDVGRAMRLGRIAARTVTATFVRPIQLEFEKVYFPYLLISKKRYAGLLWTRPEKADKMDTKGIETVRRDNCALVRQVVDRVLREILVKRDVAAAERYAKGTIADLLMNRVDLSLLVVTKALTQEPEAYDNSAPHVELAKKMRKRDPATGPQVGDRIAYVIIKGPKNARAFEKAEDPVHVLENNLPIDAVHYLEHHLEKPLMRIFEPILRNPRELLAGEHTRNVVVATPSAAAGGIMRFAQRKLTCLGCKATLDAGNRAAGGSGAVCKHCRPREGSIYRELVEGAAVLERCYADLWTQCQRCQGSLHQDVLCASRDCPIFYRRRKAEKDINQANASLVRFIG